MESTFVCLFSSAHALHQFHLIDSLTLAQKTFKLSSVPASFVSPQSPIPYRLHPFHQNSHLCNL